MTTTYEHMAQPPEDLRDQLAMLPPTTMFLDLETRYSAQEVGGWRNAHEMGMSVAFAWKPASGFQIYTEHNLIRMTCDLLRAPLVIGHNVVRFDYKVLRPLVRQALEQVRASNKTNWTTHRYLRQFTVGKTMSDPLSGIPTLDTLSILETATGRKWGLDAIAQANLGVGKNSSGLQAINLWKDQNLEELHAYCQQDVALTRDVFLFGMKNGLLWLPHGRPIRVNIQALVAEVLRNPRQRWTP